MLIDVTKKELEVIVLQLWKSRKSESNVNEVYEKMEPLLNICDCNDSKS
jgi:ribosomal 50S subunit-recycling heat shock protein